jgi:4-aminobutyrate aminotransferase
MDEPERDDTRPLDRSEAVLAREAATIGDVMKIRMYPFVVEEADGTRITDADGNDYLDFIAAAGVLNTGAKHPRVRAAIHEELDRSWSTMHCCYPSEPTVRLGERLCERLPGDFEKRAWFGATGSDANDCLAKLVPMAAGRRRMISYVGAYHGQTTGSATLSGHSAQAKVIGSGNVTKVPYPYPYRCSWGPCDQSGCSLKCLDFVEEFALGAVSPAEDTAAILLEPIQSDGGDIVPPDNYLPALRELCDRYGIWLLFDEVKTGMGRTGRFFGFEHAGVVPDGVSMGKPLGGGLPLSAVVARREILDVDTFNLFTLGGAPVPAAAGLAVLDVLQAEGLTGNAERMGARLQVGLRALMDDHPLIGEVRGRGLMIGIELVTDRTTKEPAAKDAARLVYRCFELGLIVIYCGLLGNVIEMTPPLTIDEDDVDEALRIIDRALADVEAGDFDDEKLARFAGW